MLLSLLLSLVLAILIILTVLILRMKISHKCHNRHRSKTKDPASVLIVIGSGGHTREILSLVQSLGSHYSPRYYVIAETDNMGEQKVKQCECERGKMDGKQITESQYSIFYVPRSREVKQSYLTSILTTLQALVFSIPLVFKLKPEVILCNGPGTCIPVCIGGLLLKLSGLQSTMIVYVESFCRVTSMSLSGKLLYHFADSFFVQWPELMTKYPKAKYLGRLV